jgi:hypothetical protein
MKCFDDEVSCEAGNPLDKADFLAYNYLDTY